MLIQVDVLMKTNSLVKKTDNNNKNLNYFIS